MQSMIRRFLPSLLLAAACLLWATQGFTQVSIQATPDAGLQPRLIQGDDGSTHLLYFRKRIDRPGAREGNLYYRPYDSESLQFGTRVRVSNQAFALQSYAIARAAMAMDAAGRLHVLWYIPRDSAFYYTRSNVERTLFEPQRLIVQEYVEGIDAGGDIAAFGDKVAIIWGAGDLSDEASRTMFARFSDNGGASFGAETMVSNPDLGACACCSMAADYLDAQKLLVVYRSAIDSIGRHMQLLTIRQNAREASGASYGRLAALQEWEASFCPLSTNDIASTVTHNQRLVFETEGRIIEMALPDGERRAVAAPFTETRQKNPAVAVNEDGLRLIVWAEAISHTRGGRLNMRLLNEQGIVAGFQFEDQIRIPDFSFPATAALPNGTFLVLY